MIDLQAGDTAIERRRFWRTPNGHLRVRPAQR